VLVVEPDTVVVVVVKSGRQLHSMPPGKRKLSQTKPVGQRPDTHDRPPGCVVQVALASTQLQKFACTVPVTNMA
jgi:hypothetical protein